MSDPITPEDAPPGPAMVQVPAWALEFLAVSQQALEIAEAHQAAQPDRIAAARERTQTERDRAVSEQPWDATLEVVPQIDNGDLAGLVAIAPYSASTLWGVRAALELATSDEGDATAALVRVFEHVQHPSHALLIAVAALSHLATQVVPPLLRAAEGGPDFAIRAALAEALADAWAQRVGQQEGVGDVGAE